MQGKDSIEYLLYPIALRKRRKREKKESEIICIAYRVEGITGSITSKKRKAKN